MSPRPPPQSIAAARSYVTTQIALPRPAKMRRKTAASGPSRSTSLSPQTTSSTLASNPNPTAQPHYISSPDRIYTQRKAFLYAYYAHLLQRSSLVLLFAHDNLSVPDTNRLRAAIKKIPLPAAQFTPGPTGKAAKRRDQPPQLVEHAQLTITRTGIFSALAKGMKPSTSLIPYLDGQTALLTCPSISPAYLSALLRTINRSIAGSRRPEVRDKVVKQPYLKLVAGVLEGNRLVGVEEVGRIAKLPGLDTLRGQVVGLLEGAGRGLVGVLEQAGGGGLVRTLQGLEKDLGEKPGES